MTGKVSCARRRASCRAEQPGPFAETKEHLGGFTVVDVPDDAKARYWAGRVAVAVGWPQGVHRFPHPRES
ncbi:MAG: YciI family protein [Streptosporangiaceae bacterium]